MNITQDIKDTLLPWIKYIQDRGGVIQVIQEDEETGEHYEDEAVEFVFMRKNHAIEELSMTRSDESGITLTWTVSDISATCISYDEGFDMTDMDVLEAISEISEIFPSI